MPIIQTQVANVGITPTGTLPITTNGTHDVTNYASADVNVTSSKYGCTIDNFLGDTNANGVLQASEAIGNLVFSGVEDIAESALYNKFYINSSITSVSFPNLNKISNKYACESAFSGCYNLTSMNLSNLTVISNNYGCTQMFKNCTKLSGSIDLSSLTTISSYYACNQMFYGCTKITSVDLSSLTTITGGSYTCQEMFKNCTNLTGVDLSNLTTIESGGACQNMFDSCTKLQSIDLSSLTTIPVGGNNQCYQMFQNCTSLTSADLSNLTTITQNSCDYIFSNCTNLININLERLTKLRGSTGLSYAFANCAKLTSIELSSLTYLNYNSCNGMLYGCTSLTDIYFPSLTPDSFNSYTNSFDRMVQNTGTNTTHTLHFPSNVQSTIAGLTGYPTFGGTSGYVICSFDLPATNTLTGVDTVTYTRNPIYDTATALAWKVGTYGTTDFEPAYYTSGLTDPTVGTTIYSDDACTTAVTTVDTVA